MIVEDLQKVSEPEEEPNQIYSTTPSAKLDNAHAVAGVLFDLHSKAATLAAMVDGLEESEITPEAESLMGEIMQQGPEQVQAAVVLIREYEARQAANAYEAKRYKARADKAEETAAYLKTILSGAIDEAYGGKVKTLVATVWNQDTKTEAVELREDASLEELLQSYPKLVKVTLSLDKNAVKEQEAFVPGSLAQFVEIKHNHSRSVRIR